MHILKRYALVLCVELEFNKYFWTVFFNNLKKKTLKNKIGGIRVPKTKLCELGKFGKKIGKIFLDS